jgi:hypothetical protein
VVRFTDVRMVLFTSEEAARGYVAAYRAQRRSGSEGATGTEGGGAAPSA